jgi:hypothetical protein
MRVRLEYSITFNSTTFPSLVNWPCIRRLKLLQSTIVGVIVLRLLLVPGAAFITGGARIWEQNLHPHLTQMNQSLLTIGSEVPVWS